MTRLLQGSVGFALIFFTLPVAAQELKTEKQKIEALIKHVEDMKDAKFVRNEKTYDAKTAAEFLRGKWEAQRAEIKTAKDFIEKVASVSSTTGRPYQIRFQDGKEMKSAEYLQAELKKLEKLSVGNPKP
jgi:Family of unknown function (DUF5329)